MRDPAATSHAISHRFNVGRAGFWYALRFPADHGHLIETNPKAHDNPWGRSDESVDDVVGSELLRDYLINVLRIAARPNADDVA